MIEVIYNCKKCGQEVKTKLESKIYNSGLCYYCAYRKAFKKDKPSVFENTMKNNFIVSALIVYILSIGMLYGLLFGFYYEIIGRVIYCMSTGALFGIGFMSLVIGVPRGD